MLTRHNIIVNKNSTTCIQLIQITLPYVLLHVPYCIPRTEVHYGRYKLCVFFYFGVPKPQTNIKEALTVNHDLSFGNAIQTNTCIDQSIMHFGLGMQYATKPRTTFFEYISCISYVLICVSKTHSRSHGPRGTDIHPLYYSFRRSSVERVLGLLVYRSVPLGPG